MTDTGTAAGAQMTQLADALRGGLRDFAMAQIVGGGLAADAEKRLALFKLMGAVLQLGQVDFGSGDEAAITDTALLGQICALVGVDAPHAERAAVRHRLRQAADRFDHIDDGPKRPRLKPGTLVKAERVADLDRANDARVR